MLNSTKCFATTIVAVTACLILGAFNASGQTGANGTISVTVLDQSGSAVPAAALELKDLGTNDIRKAVSQQGGTYRFFDLPFGNYQLTILAPGFQRQVFESVQVQTGRVTDISAALKVGGTTETVEVSGDATPLVESTSTVLATTVDTKQVVDLPLSGRNVVNLAFLSPGFAFTPLVVVSQTTLSQGTNGTFNNLPGGAIVGAMLDGVPGVSGRFKSAGFSYGIVISQPRIENIAEMTIQTGQMDLSGGSGTSSLQINMVTRRGSNAFHGRVFDDFRNTALNANSWLNNASRLPRNVIILNDFGGGIGGPIVKNKLFFFANFAESINPKTFVATTTINSLGSQQGIYSYKTASGAIQSINVMQIAAAAGYPSTILPDVADQFSKQNSILNLGTIQQTTDPNRPTLSFVVPARQTIKYPTFRIDYSATEKLRFNVSYNQTKTLCTSCSTPTWPGPIQAYGSNTGGVNPNNKIISFSSDWTIHPTLTNQFHAGYTGQFSTFNPESDGQDLSKFYTESFSYATSLRTLGLQPVSSFYPMLSANDTVSWQKGSHSLTIGGTWWTERDNYWNSPVGSFGYTFGISGQDPVQNAFNSATTGLLTGSALTTLQTNAAALYATLTGRVSSVSESRPVDIASKTYRPQGKFNLHEAQEAGSLFFQDRWRVTPTLTLNYGLRWDVIGDDNDRFGDYTSTRSVADLFGPTTVGQMFQPGALNGIADPQLIARVHQYNASWINPEPAIAVAWAPEGGSGFLGKLIGSGKTVIRAGYSLRAYNEGQQNFWAFGSSSGGYFYQRNTLTSTNTVSVGNFLPGSIQFGNIKQPLTPLTSGELPQFLTTPQNYLTQLSQASVFPTSLWGFNPNIRSPYVEERNIGIQRQIGPSSAIEVRYVGNLGMHSWLSYNLNEVNIYENGFLSEFKNAQNNLAINVANGKGNTFVNNGLAGQTPLPIFAAAFGTTTGTNYSTAAYITNLQQGAAGSLANTISGNSQFLCNMYGTALSACTLRGITPGAGGYPINFWRVNPMAGGNAINYADSSGKSNYNGLQIEFRQRPMHGMQFNANYTYSKGFSLATQNAIQAQGSAIYYTARNYQLNYTPSSFDIRNVIHISGTYDLPFGKGRAYLNHNKAADLVIGGWTLGTITTFQTGTPVVVNGGYGTMNQADPGIIFQNGVTQREVQSTMGIFNTGGPWKYYINPKYIASNGIATSDMAPENIPGQYGYHPLLWGPHWFNMDISLNKSFPIRERFRMTLQSEFLNVMNHPTFGPVTNGTSAVNVQSLTFGQTTGGPTGPRTVELRANIEF
jgi:hypothetical protein